MHFYYDLDRYYGFLLSFTLHIAPSELILQHRTQNATLKQFHNTTLEEMP